MIDRQDSERPMRDLIPVPLVFPEAEAKRPIAPVILRREPERSPALTPGLVIRAIARWWKVALPVGMVLAAAGAALVLFLFERKYAATALLYIPESPFSVISPEGPRQSGHFVETQIELLRQPAVLDVVVSNPDVARIPEIARRNGQDPRKWLRENLKVKRSGQSDLYEVSVPCSTAEDSATVVRAIIDEYFRQPDMPAVAGIRRVLDILAIQKKACESEVAQLQQEVLRLTKQVTEENPLAFSTGPDPFRQHPINDLQKQLVSVRVEQRVLEDVVKSLEDGLKQPPEVPEYAIDRSVAENPEVQRLQVAVLLGQRQRKEMDEVLTSRAKQDPKGPYAQLGQRIADDEKALEQIRVVAREEAKKRLQKESFAQRSEQLDSLRLELSTLKIREKTFQKDSLDTSTKAVSVSEEMLALQFKRAELDRAQQLLSQVSWRMDKLANEQYAPSGVAHVRNQIAMPTEAIEPLPYRKLGLALLAGFFAPLALAVGWERWVRRVNESHEVERESGLMVLGEVSLLPGRVRRGKKPASRRVEAAVRVFEESVDDLRTGIQLAEGLGPIRTLLVSSAVSGEGKTSVAVSLAMSLVRTLNRPTLLIDTDMRSPEIHRVFDIPPSPGLAEVLSGECSLEAAMTKLCNDRLYLLPAGKVKASPHRLVANGGLELLFRQIPAECRYVIIDSPPILAAAESQVFAKAVDACLLCAMRGVSRGDQLRKACERLQVCGGRTIGAVLSGVPRKSYAYYYRDYFARESVSARP
jgi:capsular exopolysaccharide synthesis family protein